MYTRVTALQKNVHSVALLLANSKNKKKADADVDDAADAAEDDIEPAKVPALRYQFGDEKDFPLQQAVAHLLGKTVVTHADVQAKLKAEKEKAKTTSK